MAIPAQSALLVQYHTTYAAQRCIVDITYVPIAATGSITGAALTLALAEYLAVATNQPTAALRALATTSVTFDHVRVIGMFEGETTQVAQEPMQYNGTRAVSGDSIASFIAMGFYTGSPAYKRRGASFRFPGGGEGDLVGQFWLTTLTGGAIVGAVLTQLDALLTVESTPPGSWDADLLTGVVKRIKYTTPSGKTAYRLPTEPGDLVDVMTVPDWAVNTLVTTQNGRKVRRT